MNFTGKINDGDLVTSKNGNLDQTTTLKEDTTHRKGHMVTQAIPLTEKVFPNTVKEACLKLCQNHDPFCGVSMWDNSTVTCYMYSYPSSWADIMKNAADKTCLTYSFNIPGHESPSSDIEVCPRS